MFSGVPTVLLQSLQGSGSQRGNPAVGRIDYQRRIAIRCELCTLVPPESVVGADPRLSRPVAVGLHEDFLLVLGIFLLSEYSLAFEVFRPLQRNYAGIAPDSLQIGPPIRGPWRSPLFSGTGLTCGGHHRRQDRHRDHRNPSNV